MTVAMEFRSRSCDWSL